MTDLASNPAVLACTELRRDLFSCESVFLASRLHRAVSRPSFGVPRNYSLSLSMHL